MPNVRIDRSEAPARKSAQLGKNALIAKPADNASAAELQAVAKFLVQWTEEHS
jgi:hypothetical protein